MKILLDWTWHYTVQIIKKKKHEGTKSKSLEISQIEKQRQKTSKPLGTLFTMLPATLFCKLRSAMSFEDGYIF